MITGFAGIYKYLGQASEEDRANVLKSIPMPRGTYTETLCHGRLAIASACPWSMKSSADTRLISSGNEFIMAGSGSVYNRKELTAELGLHNAADDLELIRKAWLIWGSDTPLYIEGDWMFAVYDIITGRLILCRSWGISSLYFYKGDDFFAFATHPAALTSLPGVPCQPCIDNVLRIASSIPLPAGESCYESIYQLEMGACIEIADGLPKKNTFWKPRLARRRKKYDHEKEQVLMSEFVNIYSSAVESRIGFAEQVGSTLSAGLDSASVSAIAADLLRRKGKRLHTWTSVPFFKDEAYAAPGWLADESPLAQTAVHYIGNIEADFEDARYEDPIDALRLNLLYTGRPQSAGANMYWINSILKKASRSGCSVLLTGQMGNGSVSWSPSMPVVLPKNKHFRTASWKDYGFILKRRLRTRMEKLIYRWKTGNMYDNLPLRRDYLISSGFFKNIRNMSKHRAQDRAAILREHTGILDTWYHYSYWTGVEVRDPTMDTRLIEFLLSLPDGIYYQNGINRRLVRVGMAKLLPEEITMNKLRGQQASDIVPRVRSFSATSWETLGIIEKSKLASDILDLDKMKQVLNRICSGETGADITKACSSILLRGISTGLFLAGFDTDLNLSAPFAADCRDERTDMPLDEFLKSAVF